MIVSKNNEIINFLLQNAHPQHVQRAIDGRSISSLGYGMKHSFLLGHFTDFYRGEDGRISELYWSIDFTDQLRSNGYEVDTIELNEIESKLLTFRRNNPSTEPISSLIHHRELLLQPIRKFVADYTATQKQMGKTVPKFNLYQYPTTTPQYTLLPINEQYIPKRSPKSNPKVKQVNEYPYKPIPKGVAGNFSAFSEKTTPSATILQRKTNANPMRPLSKEEQIDLNQSIEKQWTDYLDGKGELSFHKVHLAFVFYMQARDDYNNEDTEGKLIFMRGLKNQYVTTLLDLIATTYCSIQKTEKKVSANDIVLWVSFFSAHDFGTYQALMNLIRNKIARIRYVKSLVEKRGHVMQIDSQFDTNLLLSPSEQFLFNPDNETKALLSLLNTKPNKKLPQQPRKYMAYLVLQKTIT